MATLDEKNTYYIDYGTGAGNFEFTGTLEEAMEEANKGLCFTSSSFYFYKRWMR